MNYGGGPGYGYGGTPQYHGPPNGVPTGPREHPSANTALGLGLASIFCLGVFLGVPAIIIGRKVVAAAEREPYRWRGAGTARVGIVLGWISVAETAFVCAMKMTEGWKSAIALIAFAAVGLTFLAMTALKALPPPLALVTGLLRRAPLAAGLGLGGLLAGATFGLLGAIGAQQQVDQKCAAARVRYSASAKGTVLDGARIALTEIQRDCAGSEAEVATMRRELEVKESDARKKKDADERAAAEKVAADKEKSAVDTFPDKSKDVAATVKRAQAKAWQGKVEESDEELDAATRQLDTFKGTSVATSKDFGDLVALIAERRKAIQPQVERLREKRRTDEAAAADKRSKVEAAAAIKELIRGPRPTNSAWDGSVSSVERVVKASMHDPSSYSHVSTTVPVAEGDYWTVVSSFRGKNAFGALVINSKKFFIQSGVVVKTADVGGGGGDDDE